MRVHCSNSTYVWQRRRKTATGTSSVKIVSSGMQSALILSTQSFTSRDFSLSLPVTVSLRLIQPLLFVVRSFIHILWRSASVSGLFWSTGVRATHCMSPWENIHLTLEKCLNYKVIWRSLLFLSHLSTSVPIKTAVCANCANRAFHLILWLSCSPFFAKSLKSFQILAIPLNSMHGILWRFPACTRVF